MKPSASTDPASTFSARSDPSSVELRATRREAARWLRTRRVVDASIVILSIPITVPLALVTMVAVWLQDRCIPLIRLDRVGLQGKPIRLVKIRTMRPVAPDTDGGSSITASVDDRVTPLGSILRSTRMDELPQLVSVLTGKLALVGPRPEAAAFVDSSNPLWVQALTVKPGIAGITQIIASPWEEIALDGVNPEEKYAEIAVPAKVAVDAWYARNASLRVDLMVCTSLVSMMLLGRSWTAVHRLVDREVPEASVLLEPFRPQVKR